MTGSRALRCICCQILRVTANRTARYQQALMRHARNPSSLHHDRFLSTSSQLLAGKKGGRTPGEDVDIAGQRDESSALPDQLESGQENVSSSEAGGDVSASESSSDGSSSDSSGSSSSDSDSDGDVDKLDPTLVSAVKNVAQNLPGDRKMTEANLLAKLLTQYKTTDKQKAGQKPGEREKKLPTTPTDFSSLMAGMKVSRKGFGQWDDMRGQEEVQYRDTRSDKHEVGLFEGEPFGVFTEADLKNASPDRDDLFSVVAKEQADVVNRLPPSNPFQEMIQWTRDGKLWTFPIDNEAGWEEEKKVKFTEHVFLEREIRDFPTKGPIRHFIELVTTALSKNPHLTVQQKREHIDWYREYFRGKQDILEERLGEQGVLKDTGKTVEK